MKCATLATLTFAVVVGLSTRPVEAEPPAASAPALTSLVNQALAVLGQPRLQVVIFDPLQYDASHRATLERFEAFVLARKPEIYLNRRGQAIQEALSGRPDGVYIVAAILAHERAHLDGKDETGALKAEEECVYRFMKEGRIPVDVALAHLQSAWRLRR
jgi:hypothetical protein